MTHPQLSLIHAKNIGTKIFQELNSIDIHTIEDLERVSPAGAYVQLSEKKGAVLPCCYYLYSFQGALLDVDWRELTDEMKVELKLEVRRLRVAA